MNATKPGPAHDNRCDQNHPNEGNDHAVGHHNPDCAPETAQPIPTTTEPVDAPVAVPETPTTAGEVPSQPGDTQAIERHDTDHAEPVPATETTTAEVAVSSTPASLPDTGAGLGLVPFGLAVVIGGTILARRFRTQRNYR